MGINFGTEYKRFKREMEQKHKLYTKLGMSQEQIDALDEFDKEEFLSDNTYKRHVQSLSVDIDSEAAEDMHPLFKKFGAALSVELKVKFRDKYTRSLQVQGFCLLFAVSLALIIAQIGGNVLCRNAF